MNYIVELLGDKWSLLILRDMIFQQKYSYSDFLGSEEKIATNILASRLASLEDSGFLKKLQNPENKAQYVYVPTDITIDFIPLLVEMMLWSEKNASLPISEERQAELQEIHTNKEAFIQETRERVLAHVASKYRDEESHGR